MNSISYVGQYYCVNCPFGSSNFNIGSSYCEIESDHSYLNSNNVVVSPLFYLFGVVRYTFSFDANTSISACNNGCDSLVVSTPDLSNSDSEILHVYSSVVDNSNSFQVASTNGFVLKLKTDSISSVSDWGYRVRITPLDPDLSSILDIKVDLSFEVSGVSSSDINENTVLQDIFADALIVGFNNPKGMSVNFLEATTSASSSVSTSSNIDNGRAPGLRYLMAGNSNFQSKWPHVSLSSTVSRLSFAMIIPSADSSDNFASILQYLLKDSFTSGRVIAYLNSLFQSSSDSSVNSYYNSVVLDDLSIECSLSATSETRIDKKKARK